MSVDSFEGNISRLQAQVKEQLNQLSTDLVGKLGELQAPQSGSGGIDAEKLFEITTKFSDATTQVELLSLLVQSCADIFPRVLLLIRKGPNVHGWAGNGFDPNFLNGGLKRVRWQVDSYPELMRVIHQGKTLVANFSDLSDLSEEITGFDQFTPLKSCFIPLKVKGKVAAVLYGDSGSETNLPNRELAQVIVHLCGLELTMVTAKLKTNTKTADLSNDDSGSQPEVPRKETPAPRPSAPPKAEPPAPRQSAPPPSPQPPPQPAEDISFSSPSMEMPADPAPAPAPSRAAASNDPPAIKKAKRVARVLVSDLKLYNEDAVKAAQKSGGLYEKLRDDIDRSYKHYQERVSSLLPNHDVNYFKEELIRQLGDGDEARVGKLPF